MLKNDSPDALIWLLTYSYAYDDPRVMPIAQSLVQLGYSVKVIGVALRQNLPAKAFLHGVTVWLIPFLANTGIKTILHYLWCCVRADLRDVNPDVIDRRGNKLTAILTNLWVLRLGLVERPAAIHCHAHSLLPAAWLLARWHRVPLAYDACESVPDLFQHYPNTLMTRFTQRIEAFVIPRADAVITVGVRLAERLRERGARQVVVVGNWKRLEDYAVPDQQVADLKRSLGLPTDKLIIGFFGNLASTTYELELLLEVMNQIDDVMLLISGQGELRTVIQQQATENANIRWLDWIAMSELPMYTAATDVIFCCLKDTFAQAYYVVPNKLFEAFAAARPVLARRGVGEMAVIIEETEAGILLDEATPSTLKAALRTLHDSGLRTELAQRALVARTQYNWEMAEDRLRILYMELLK
jgi:glycosyltransferase involved in cell wall biosynthesis